MTWETFRDESTDALATGDLDGAIVAARNAMSACETALGRDTVEFARCMLGIAVAHHYRSMNDGPREDASAALALSADAYAIAQRVAGAGDPRLVEFAKWHAEALIESDDLAGAARVLAQISTTLEVANSVDPDGARALTTYGKLLHRLGETARRDDVMKRATTAWETLIETDPDTALDHRRNLAATHNNLCYYLFQGENFSASVDHAWLAFEHYERCHDDGLELAPSLITVLNQNARNSYVRLDSTDYRIFKALADTLRSTPGRRAMWEGLVDELSYANEAFGVTDADIARAFLQWLREDTMPEPYSNLAITNHMLPKLRRRLMEPTRSSLLAMLPMSLQLVEAGDRSLADALNLCADGDVLGLEGP
ncbi:MAG: hypothetical protein NT062_36285 [Proteobacteria bacterium]|nr:hypothetical protein [Pseudomonadota bacterium]